MYAVITCFGETRRTVYFDCFNKQYTFIDWVPNNMRYVKTRELSR